MNRIVTAAFSFAHENALARCFGPLPQIFTAAFFICALVVASIANAGFDVVLTGLLLCAWEVGAMWLLKRGPHETSVRANQAHLAAVTTHAGFFCSCFLLYYVLLYGMLPSWGGSAANHRYCTTLSDWTLNRVRKARLAPPPLGL